MLSVVIPAHNEEAVIDRCLRRLLADASADQLEIIVAAHGCTDRTVELAARHRAVRVLVLPVASRRQALGAGDAAAHHFPRAFVDPDVEVGADALLAAARAMARMGAQVGTPAMRLDLSGCPWAVRAYCRVWSALAEGADRSVGLGVYLLSHAGHARLERFPEAADDGAFVDAFFALHERVTVRDHVFVARPPRTLRGLVQRRVRVLEGRRELAAVAGPLAPDAARAETLRVLRRRPWLAPDVPVFFGVRLAAERALRGAPESEPGGWEGDGPDRALGERAA